MAFLRGSRSPRIVAPSLRRKTSWQEGPFGRATLSVASSTVLATGQAAQEDGLTIVRIRGELIVALTSAVAVADGYDRCAAGICIVSENAAGVGITAIPTPVTDLAWDGWMWHSSFAMMGAGIIAGGAADDAPLGTAFLRLPIDSKSMRKIKNTDVLLAVVETTDLVGGATARFVLNSRVLVKLP